MAITLTTPIPVVNNIANLTKWAVVDYQDYQAATVPYVSLLVRVSGGGGKVYGLYRLNATDAQNSLCLMPNPTSVSMNDQLMVGYRQLTTAYTTITNAHDTATGNNKAKLAAVEATLISVGLIDTALEGS